ncbi:MAG: hypothetical protein L0229_12855 [Blastocatellia bacterium]|nr:hypothetical protein [Blastocatellia bacterium]
MSKSKKKPKKPTGTIGPIIITPHDRSAEFCPIDFPTDKAEVERYIVPFVIDGLRKTGTNFYKLVENPIQNPEDDFDFTLPTESGKEYLELMEVAALDHFGKFYDAAPASYNHGELADHVYTKLMAKAKKYGSLSHVPVHLLLYTTDWRFRLSQKVLALLAYWCLRREHSFKTILYFVPDDATHGEVKILYPIASESLANFDEQAARNTRSIIGDPTRLQVNPDGSVEIPLGPLRRE